MKTFLIRWILIVTQLFILSSAHAFQSKDDFNFMLGKWDVGNTQGVNGAALFEGKLNHTVLIMDLVLLDIKTINGQIKNIIGKTLITYSTSSKEWRLTWSDNTGSHFTGKGGLVDNQMVLIADRIDQTGSFLHRMTYTPVSDNRVKYTEDFSYDSGASWGFPWSLTFVRDDSAIVEMPAAVPIDSSKINHELDFLLGKWSLKHSGSGTGNTVWKRFLHGQGIFETTSLVAPSWSDRGYSLISYSHFHKRWSLTWADEVNAHFTAVGGLEDNKAVLIADMGTYLFKHVYWKQSENTVKYESSNSYDGGKTWIQKWPVTYTKIISNIDNKKENQAVNFKLQQNYPNPFNPKTTISYNLAQKSSVTLKIYNTMGEEVKSLYRGDQSTGEYLLQWDGRDNNGGFVASGIYLYKLVADYGAISKKMIYLK